MTRRWKRLEKVWLVLSVVGSISTTVVLFALGQDTDDKLARLEQRVKALEGSASDAKDDASALSKRIEGVQAQFWE
jgi:hypothetical protein